MAHILEGQFSGQDAATPCAAMELLRRRLRKGGYNKQCVYHCLELTVCGDTPAFVSSGWKSLSPAPKLLRDNLGVNDGLWFNFRFYMFAVADEPSADDNEDDPGPTCRIYVFVQEKLCR